MACVENVCQCIPCVRELLVDEQRPFNEVFKRLELWCGAMASLRGRNIRQIDTNESTTSVIFDLVYFSLLPLFS